MAFKQQYKCEFCDEIVWEFEAPAECACQEHEWYFYPYKVEPMSKSEKKARYAKQYLMNGYDWLGVKPTMFMGAFDEYPAR